MATGIEELEEYRVKSSREMVSLGHRYGHCLGTLWCSKDVFYHKDEAVAQVRDGKIVQIHGPGNRYTSACKTLEALIKRTHRNK